LLPYISVAVTQAGVAGLSSYGIGQVTKQYLANGAAWGPNGPKTVVRDILASVDQTFILNRIKEELRMKLGDGKGQQKAEGRGQQKAEGGYS
jgi:GTPase